jgi:uncharacterized protein YoxC
MALIEIKNLHLHVAIENAAGIMQAVQQILTNQNKIIMTTQEAVEKLNGVATQLGKVRTEVQKLVDAAANNGNVSPELQAAIDSVAAAVQGVDDLNADETPTEEPVQ